jgi:hypothetical protein
VQWHQDLFHLILVISLRKKITLSSEILGKYFVCNHDLITPFKWSYSHGSVISS